MAKNQIDLGQIESRISRGQGSDDFEPRRRPQVEEAPRRGVKLFSLGLIAVLISGAGAYTASNAGAGLRYKLTVDLFGEPPSTYKSRVAAACDPGWKDNRDNRDQIHCYMTHDVFRLCNPRERLALGDKLLAFQAATNRMEGDLAMTAFGMVGNPAVLTMGIAEAESHDVNLTDKEQADKTIDVMNMANGLMAPAYKIIAESQNDASDGDIARDVKNLAQRGFLAASDFPDKMPKLVREGLAAAGHVTPQPCI